MAWQKCPVCNGTGKNYGAHPSLIYNSNCPTCNGQRIISELTGKPPATKITSGSTTEIVKGSTTEIVKGSTIGCNNFEPDSTKI